LYACVARGWAMPKTVSSIHKTHARGAASASLLCSEKQGEGNELKAEDAQHVVGRRPPTLCRVLVPGPGKKGGGNLRYSNLIGRVSCDLTVAILAVVHHEETEMDGDAGPDKLTRWFCSEPTRTHKSNKFIDPTAKALVTAEHASDDVWLAVKQTADSIAVMQPNERIGPMTATTCMRDSHYGYCTRMPLPPLARFFRRERGAVHDRLPPLPPLATLGDCVLRLWRALLGRGLCRT